MDALNPTIVTAALAAATIAKILVDLVRMTNTLPAWAAPLLAVGFGVVSAFLLLLANGTTLDTQTGAQAVLAGIIAASTAIGSTELQKREKVDPEALGYTVADLHTTLPDDAAGLIEEPEA